MRRQSISVRFKRPDGKIGEWHETNSEKEVAKTERIATNIGKRGIPTTIIRRDLASVGYSKAFAKGFDALKKAQAAKLRRAEKKRKKGPN